jgi:uncharacterized protein YaaR (DUF327 family)
MKKKNIKDFERILKEQIEKNLSSQYSYDRNNAVRLALYYCEGYFKNDNTSIYKTIKLINDNN